MSWIFASWLVGYLGLRCVLALRGQVRLWRLRDRLPVRPRARPRPRDLGAGLERLLDRNFVGQVELVESSRSITTLLITDPDVPFGWVRDFRYRLAVARAWSAACAWLADLEALSDEDRVRLEHAGYTARSFRDHHACLHRTVRTTVRARALETFPVAEVEATCARVTAMAEELTQVEQALVRGGQGPYR